MLNAMKILVKKIPKFKVGDHVRISKYKNTFAKGYTSNWPEEVFLISKIKNTVPWTYVISDLNSKISKSKFNNKDRFDAKLPSLNRKVTSNKIKAFNF